MALDIRYLGKMGYFSGGADFFHMHMMYRNILYMYDTLKS